MFFRSRNELSIIIYQVWLSGFRLWWTYAPVAAELQSVSPGSSGTVDANLGNYSVFCMDQMCFKVHELDQTWILMYEWVSCSSKFSLLWHRIQVWKGPKTWIQAQSSPLLIWFFFSCSVAPEDSVRAGRRRPVLRVSPRALHRPSNASLLPPLRVWTQLRSHGRDSGGPALHGQVQLKYWFWTCLYRKLNWRCSRGINNVIVL